MTQVRYPARVPALVQNGGLNTTDQDRKDNVRRSTTTLVIAFLLATFAVPTTKVAAGNEQSEAEAVIQQLENATDKGKAFAELSPAKKAIAKRALTVARTDTSEERTAHGGKIGNAAPSMVSGCRGMTLNHNATNWYGYLLWRYSQTLYWCWSTDSNTVYGLSHYQSVLVNCCWWEYKGTIGDYHRGGENQSYFYAWAQGSFAFCPSIIGCTQFRYPQVWQQVDGQGGYVSGIGG